MDGDRPSWGGSQSALSRSRVTGSRGRALRGRGRCEPRSAAATRHSPWSCSYSPLHPCIHPPYLLSHPVQCPLLRFTSVCLPPLLTTPDPSEPLRDSAVTASAHRHKPSRRHLPSSVCHAFNSHSKSTCASAFTFCRLASVALHYLRICSSSSSNVLATAPFVCLSLVFCWRCLAGILLGLRS